MAAADVHGGGHAAAGYAGGGVNGSSDDLAEQFKAAVHRHHAELLQRGVDANEAAALALRAAAGQVSMPPRLEDVLGALERARSGGSGGDYGAACRAVRALFSSPDALHTCFWPQPDQQQPQQQQQPDHQQQQLSEQQQQLPPWLRIDHGAVWRLRGALEACGAAAMAVLPPLSPSAAPSTSPPWLQLREALAAGCRDLLLHIDDAAVAPWGGGLSGSGGGLKNLGFTRQVCALLLANPWLGDLGGCGLDLVAGIAGVLVEAAGPPPSPSSSSSLCGGGGGASRGASYGEQLRQLFRTWGEPELKHAVAALQQYITLTLYDRQALTPGVEASTRLLGELHAANFDSDSGGGGGGGSDSNDDDGIDDDSGSDEEPDGGRRRASGAAASTSSDTQHHHHHQQQQHQRRRRRRRPPPLDAAEFYNPAVNEPDFNVREDYRRWTTRTEFLSEKAPFSFCAHAWVFDPATKAAVLRLESQMQQLQAYESSVVQALMGGPSCPFLLLKVRRGPYLLSDTLLQVNRARQGGALKKPLRVKFVGEEGVDEGGPQKEFFQLLVRQCFNPAFGMFTYDEATRLHWFRASSMQLSVEYELIGVVVGLAIYNGHILDFQFPLVLFKKLLGRPVGGSLDDLKELQPAVARSLRQLLAMGEEELAALGLTFQIETEVDDFDDGGGGDGSGDSSAGVAQRRTAAVDLVPNGASVPVTRANVRRYVKLYCRHLLVGAVAAQFDAFRRGFLRLCGGAALQFFAPEELERLVCGGRTVDLAALERATRYEGGFSRASRCVAWFWEVAHALNPDQQKRLLSFITGSDRVPIKGLGHLMPPFTIARNGADGARLPTAHTCFNTLLLPGYRDRDTLRARLLLALENAEGFGLM